MGCSAPNSVLAENSRPEWPPAAAAEARARAAFWQQISVLARIALWRNVTRNYTIDRDKDAKSTPKAMVLAGVPPANRRLSVQLSAGNASNSKPTTIKICKRSA